MTGKAKDKEYWKNYFEKYGQETAVKKMAEMQSNLMSAKMERNTAMLEIEDLKARLQREGRKTSVLEDINSNLANLLKKFKGLKTHYIRVTYKERYCNAEYGDDCEEIGLYGPDACLDCEYFNSSLALETRYVYAYTVSDEELNVILPDFTSSVYDKVVKVDEYEEGRRYRTIWEKEKENDND